ncbi:unnamed protein product [Schistocephalus solidus]|uniref:UDP-N-acetylglucosamine transporter n=2 Tax=Schistocephalus solidus TaxID=70667 RepID=A0A183T368_SCHSO|nr:unnamed protein product [Schistocephalus solidus]
MVSNSFIKSASLCILAVQNVLHTIAMRCSRQGGREPFMTSSALIMGETLKVIISTIMLIYEKKLERAIYAPLRDPIDFLRTAVPAIVYVFQNSLLFFALSCLDATVFQVTYQIKLLTTALFSVFFLGKSISRPQWASLVLLFAGVAIVQATEHSSDRQHSSSASTALVPGLLAVLTASCLSGFAAVYFEKILKQSTKSLWERNFELAFISVIFATSGQLITEGDVLRSNGFFYGFDWLVWVVILLQSGGGIVVALVVKYADNILKASLLSILCFNPSLYGAGATDFIPKIY